MSGDDANEVEVGDDQEQQVEALAAEYIERCRAGESPSVDEYADTYPDLAETIRDVFPMIAAIEGLKVTERKAAARSATSLPLELTELGDFRIVREVGRGGMGIVYEAEQTSLGRRVALKVLPKQALLDPAQLKRFQREARIAARLHHSNVVSLFGVGDHDGYHFLVMELIDGVSLDKIIPEVKAIKARDGELAAAPVETPVPMARQLARLLIYTSEKDGERDTATTARPKKYWRNVARLGRDAARGLQYAADQGVLHRDIKPGNLILDVKGHIWISDFGLAQQLTAADGTVTQSLGGTLCYMSPEGFSGPTDSRSDVYSLGLTLYELVTLQAAFTDHSPAAAMKRLANQNAVARPRQVDATIPRDLGTIILKASAQQPDRRYATADELANDLQRFLDDVPIRARRTSSLERFARWCRRNKAVASLSALAATLLLVATAVMSNSYFRERQANQQVSSALQREMKQRERSETMLLVAAEALDNIYRDFSPGTLGSDQPDEATRSSRPTLSPETANVLENLLKFYDRLAAEDGDSLRLQDAAAQAMSRIGDIYRQLGKHELSLKHYHEALATLSQNQSAEDGTSHQSEIARLHNEIGRVHFAAGDFRQATVSHQAALKALSPFGQKPPATVDAYERARTLYFLGRRRPVNASRVALRQLSGFASRRSRPERPDRPKPPERPRERDDERRGNREREKHLHNAIATIRELAPTSQRLPDHQFLLACCLRDLSPPPRGRMSLFRSNHRSKAIELLTDLVDRFPNNESYRFELVEALRSNETGPRSEKPVREQSQQLTLASQHADWLVEQHPNIPQYAMARMHVLHMRGHRLTNAASRADDQQQRRYLDRAVKLQQQAADQMQTLTERWPDVAPYQLWSIVVDGSLTQVYLRTEQLDAAQQTLKRAEELLDRFASPTTDSGTDAAGQPSSPADITQIRRALNALQTQLNKAIGAS